MRRQQPTPDSDITSSRPAAHKGYSLIEMAVVLAIIGTVTGGALVLADAQDKSSKAKTTHERLERIEQAIQLHAYASAYLPCPAVPMAPENDAVFGVSEDCSLASPSDASVQVVNPGANEEIWIGAVPTRSLNLPDSAMFDGWGNRFTYAVVKNLAVADGLENFSTSVTTGVITIQDAAGNQIPNTDTRNAVGYALLSHGPDGKGAYNRSGVQTAACATVSLDKENCTPNEIFVDARIADSTIAANHYDDMLRWKLANFMQPAVVTAAPLPPPPPASSFPLSGGWQNTCAGKSDGTVWCWGSASLNTSSCNPMPCIPATIQILNAALGDGTNTNRLQPVQVLGLTNVIGGGFGDSGGCAIKSDGTAWCWGWNSSSQYVDGGGDGRVGDGTTIDRFTPVQVSGLTNAQEIKTGEFHSCALKPDGTVWCWGRNAYGQLGDGTTTDRLTPVQVPSLGMTATQIYVGDWVSCAIKNDGTAWCWGRNQNGQLGDGTTTDRSTPVQVSALTNVVQIVDDQDHGCAVKTNGTVWCWGDNFTGHLGDGTTTDRLTPVQVSGLTGVTQVAMGSVSVAPFTDWEGFNCALKTDGTVWCWGRNAYGQLGDGTITDRHTPVQASGLTGISELTVGDTHTCVRKSDKTIWCWGSNVDGQLGNNTTTNSLTPVQVLNLP